MNSARLTPIDPLSDPRWDRFVRCHPDATAYHLAAWMAVLRDAYRFRPRCLALEEEGSVVGVLPLTEGRGPVSGRRMRSLPVVPVAGPLAGDDTAAGALVEEALRLGESNGRTVTVDSRHTGLEHGRPRLTSSERPPAWIAALPRAGQIDAWLAERSKNLVRGVRRAERAGVRVRLAAGAGDLRRFHRLYLQTMRNHRSLPRTLRQLELSRRLLEPEGIFRLFLAEHEGRVAAGGVFHAFNGTVELLYSASDDALLDLRPNHALYREVVAWSADHGFSRLDWGFAWPDSSLAAFKQQWGGQPVANVRYAHASGGSPPADAGTAAADRMQGRAGQLLSDAWGRAPLALTDVAGRLAYRWL